MLHTQKKNTYQCEFDVQYVDGILIDNFFLRLDTFELFPKIFFLKQQSINKLEKENKRAKYFFQRAYLPEISAFEYLNYLVIDHLRFPILLCNTKVEFILQSRKREKQ